MGSEKLSAHHWRRRRNRGDPDLGAIKELVRRYGADPTLLYSIEEILSDDERWSEHSDADAIWGEALESEQSDLRLGSSAWVFGQNPDGASGSSGFVEDYAPEADNLFKNATLQQLNCDVISA